MLWREHATTLCTPEFWLWLTEDKEVHISLKLQKMSDPLTHLPSCWKTFLEQTWVRLLRWVELNQDCVDVSPAGWPWLARTIYAWYKCLWREPYTISVHLSVKSSCSTFCDYSLPHFCVLEPQKQTGLVAKGSKAQQDPHQVTHLGHLNNLQLYVLRLLQASCRLRHRDVLDALVISLGSPVVCSEGLGYLCHCLGQ